MSSSGSRVAALDQLTSWPVKAGAAGVVDRHRPVGLGGDADRPMPWASVTKLLTALTVLVAVEEGTVDLDQAAGPPGSTVRHLFAHASGLPMDGDLHDLDRLAMPPGRRRIYSNLGFEVLADVVAEAAAMPFADYLNSAVVEPLLLADTRLDGSPAWSAVGPLIDLLSVGRELLAPTIIAAETLAVATAVAFPGLAGVLPGFGYQDPNDWGLGFELRDHKRPHWTGTRNSPQTFGHFGRSGAFLWVDPVAGVACGALADRQFGSWAAAAWPRLSDAVVAEYGHPPQVSRARQ